MFLLFSSGLSLAIYAVFVPSVTRLPLLPIVDVARAKLRPLTDFGVSAGLVWSVGVSLFVLFFRINFELYSAIGVLILTTIGLIAIGWPQFVVHFALERLKNLLLSQVALKLHAQVLDGKQNQWGRLVNNLMNSYDNLSIDFVQATANAHTWTYSPKDIASIGGTLVIPLISMILSQLLEHMGN